MQPCEGETTSALTRDHPVAAGNVKGSVPTCFRPAHDQATQLN